MVKESQNKTISKPITRSSKRREEESRKLKEHESSDSDIDFVSESEDEEDEDKFDMQEYRKFLAKMYPSKHINKKVDAGEKLKDVKKKVDEKPVNKNQNKKNSKKKEIETESETELETDTESESKTLSCSESEEDEDEDETENSEEDDDDDDDDTPSHQHKKMGKFNIIFTIGGPRRNNEENEDEDEDEDYDEDEENNNKDDNIEEEKKEEVKEEKKEEENADLLEILKSFQEKNKTNPLINECIKTCEDKIKDDKEKKEKLTKKEKAKNSKIFRKILRDKNTLNDFEFFNKLELESQTKILKELKEINKITRIEKPYRLTLLESNIPVKFKGAAIKKINTLRYMEPGSGEFYKIKNWVDTFMRIPFGKYNTLPVSIEDGVEKCHEFMENSQKILNDAVYGMNDAKMQIMQMLGQLITNPSALGTAIAIHGAPGTGKTSIVKEGISKILNRPFAFIALGGATDSSFLEGHSYTYEGSTWGKIVQIIIDSKCMNPVIYFDELDKISETPKGEEIVGILTHLTDTTQNSQFHDKYFAEIDFDLSKCLFIFSYNDETKVNPILKDRMYRIQTKGYNQNDKLVISNNYLLPKIREQVKFKNEDITIPEQTINYIITKYCEKEEGVRNLKRCLEIVYTKLNLYRLMRPDTNLFGEDMTLKVEFPFTVTNDVVDKLIKINRENISALHSMYI